MSDSLLTAPWLRLVSFPRLVLALFWVKMSSTCWWPKPTPLLTMAKASPQDGFHPKQSTFAQQSRRRRINDTKMRERLANAKCGVSLMRRALSTSNTLDVYVQKSVWLALSSTSLAFQVWSESGSTALKMSDARCSSYIARILLNIYWVDSPSSAAARRSDKACDQKLSTAIVFLELSKAFDNVRHQQLLTFLQRFHIGGTVLQWFSNYLTGRAHRVVVNDQASDEFICTKGVPQDSVLGPLLFNLYVADLHSIAARYNVSLSAFAEDMSLYCSRKAMEYACSDVSKALTSISSELESRGLTVNCEKTVAMVIHPRSSKTSALPSIIIARGRTTIPLVDSTGMLGVIIVSNLSWKEHVDHVCLN